MQVLCKRLLATMTKVDDTKQGLIDWENALYTMGMTSFQAVRRVIDAMLHFLSCKFQRMSNVCGAAKTCDATVLCS